MRGFSVASSQSVGNITTAWSVQCGVTAQRHPEASQAQASARMLRATSGVAGANERPLPGEGLGDRGLPDHAEASRYGYHFSFRARIVIAVKRYRD
jgi:hypothetical protein